MQSVPKLDEMVRPKGKMETQDLPLPADAIRRSIVEVLSEAPGPLAFQDAEAVDAYIRAERDTWDNE